MENMILVNSLEKSYKLHQRALPIISVSSWFVKKGERIALLGPSGSGKSTLLHLIGGILAVDQGTVEVAGEVISEMNEMQRDRFRARKVGYVFQDFYLIPSLTAQQNVELVMERNLSRSEHNKLIEQWFERVGLTGKQNQRPYQLSRGQQQRVAIIRALINHPPLILADEPTGSLDWETAAFIMKLLLDICEENNATLLTVTHDLHLAQLYPATVQMDNINLCIQHHALSKKG
ncbi:ABC transporter ATP-binding protein [Paenibacillus endoradicis]|uniref:ABC transporter ATP-binding protein n=1 Tax=Paenibacillus endoradicis TaxID=2972487 RepID=UPI002158FEED|nr:ABC transporter ATP-binding protein [Paenibacillus endoradicis]MCR8659451.1 ABC transporter ATP-binding protein [Paenibacillus endoradicis]